jgi:hypothetical protein
MCMYCGATTLPTGIRRFTDEHIVPFALGGNLVLPEASYIACAKIINQQIETPVLLKEWVYLRIKRNFPSRNKNNKRERRKTHVTLTRHDGSPMHIGIVDYSCLVPLYKFKEARIFSGAPRGDDNLHWTMDFLSSHDDEMEMQRRFPEWNRQHKILTRCALVSQNLFFLRCRRIWIGRIHTSCYRHNPWSIRRLFLYSWRLS